MTSYLTESEKKELQGYKSIPSSAEDKARVGRLNLDLRKSMALPAEITQCTNVYEVDLGHSAIKDIEEAIDLLSSLPHLEICNLGTLSQRVPASIAKLSGLKWLVIKAENLAKLPLEIQELQSLEGIVLEVHAWNGTGPHIAALGKLPHLKAIHFRWNVPKGLELLGPLESVKATYVSQIPNHLPARTELRRLELLFSYQAGVQELPWLSGMTQLEDLQLWSDHMITLPDDLSMCGALRNATLKFPISGPIPKGVCTLAGLEDLRMYQARLNEIPECIGNLRQLRKLELGRNHLKRVPASLLQCTSLVSIGLRENNIEEFPTECLQLPQLESLDLGQNKISSVADTMPNAPALNYVSLDSNKLQEFPWVLALCPKAKLYMDGNPFLKKGGYKMEALISAVSEMSVDLPVRQTLFALAIGDVDKAVELGETSHFAVALNSRQAKLRAFASEALGRYAGSPFELEFSRIRYLGQNKALPLDALRQRLSGQPIGINVGDEGGPDEVLVLLEEPGDVSQYLAAGSRPANLSQLLAWIEKGAQPWLKQDRPTQPVLVERLRRLLLSANDENITMALQMMVSGGMPAGMEGLMLAIVLLHRDGRVAGEASKLLELNSSASLKSFLAANKRNVKAMGREKVHGYFNLLGTHPEIEVGDLVRMASGFDSSFLEFIYTDLTGDELRAGFVKDGCLRLSPFFPGQIPKAAAHLSGILELRGSGEEIKQLSPEVGMLKDLVSLELSNTKLSDLPDALGSLAQLRTVGLEMSRLKNFPVVLAQVPNLESLRLVAGQLQSLPKEVAGMQTLRSLDLTGNDFKEFPRVLLELPRLHKLSIGSNDAGAGLRELPGDLNRMMGLDFLALNRCGVGELPASMSEMQLSTLVLNHTHLTDVPEVLKSMPGLTYLDLSNNPALRSLGKAIGEVKGLQTLVLSHLELDDLPEALVGLVGLRTIVLLQTTLEQIEAAVDILSAMPALESVVISPRRSNRELYEACVQRLGGKVRS